MTERNAIGARLARLDRVRLVVEEGADVAILDRAAEQVAALGDDARVEDRAIARRQHRADRLRQPHLVRGEQPSSRHPQRVARPEPADDERRRFGRRLDRQPAVGGQRRRRLGVERRPVEELPQRRLQQAVVQRADGDGGGRDAHSNFDQFEWIATSCCGVSLRQTRRARPRTGAVHEHDHARDTLIDFFRDLVTIRGDFLVFDDGYRRRVHTYEEVGRAARGLRGPARGGRAAQGRQSRVLGREPARVDRLLLGLPASPASIVVPIDYRSSAEFVDKVRRPGRCAGRAASATTSTSAGRRRPAVDTARRSVAGFSWQLAPTSTGSADGPDARRRRSRATTSSRSSSRPAPRPSPRASSSGTATCSPTSSRSSGRS